MGRRLPWIAGGAIGGALSLMVLSVAHNVVVMAIGWCGVQATLNAMLAAVTATVPYCLGSRDLPLAPSERPAPFEWRVFLRSFWLSPRRYPDFAWAWLTRFLVNLGNALGLLYLLYYMQDVVGFGKDEAADKVFVLTAIYAATLLLTAVVFGIWSDRSGRRKVFVVWLGVVAALAALLLAVGQSWGAAAVAAAVMGCGFGIYTSVDFALITQVLPGAGDRAKEPGRHQHRERAAPGVRAGPGQRDPAVRGARRRDRRDQRVGLLGRLLRRLRRGVRRVHPRLGLRHPDQVGALGACRSEQRRFWVKGFIGCC
jgi:hypothetical protein